jgi:hypothetical protein
MWLYLFREEFKKWRWRFCLLQPVFVILLNILEPLKSDLVTYNYHVAYNVIAYLILLTILVFFIIILPKIIPFYFDSSNWNFLRFCIWATFVVLSTSIASFFFDVYFIDVKDVFNWSTKYFLYYQIPILLFNISPILLFLLFYKPIFNEKILVESINYLDLPLQYEKFEERKLLNVKDASNRLVLNLFKEEIYYFKASDNYIELFYKKAENPVDAGNPDYFGKGLYRLVIRNSLKDVESQFSEIPQLFRCHKAFIINTDKMQEISGNTKGFFVKLEDVLEKIPVSRAKNDDLKKHFSAFFV